MSRSARKRNFAADALHFARFEVVEEAVDDAALQIVVAFLVSGHALRLARATNQALKSGGRHFIPRPLVRDLPHHLKSRLGALENLLLRHVPTS